MKNMLRLALTLVALMAAVACGSDLPSSPISPATPTPGNNPPPAPPQAPFKQTLSGSVGARGTVFQAFSAPRSGTASFKLTWTNDANDLEFILTDGACPDIYGPNANCPYLAAAEELNGTLRTMSATTTAGQSYRIWVDNFGYSAQPFTIEIEIQ